MPELPEAETIARELHTLMRGATLDRVTLRRRDIVHGDPRPLSRILPGRIVRGVRRRAKRVILDLDPHTELVFHLGMSGRLTLQPHDDPVEKHTHLRIRLRDSDQELRFRDPRRFGGVWCLTGSSRHVGKRLGPLGGEPLEMKPAAFRRLLQRRRQIKALLLDQRVIAGIGNIYCDEALHAANIHPVTQAAQLESSEAGRLLRAIKSTLNKAIRFNGTTLKDYRRADGTTGSFRQFHRVYDRKGKPCQTCETPIERIIAAGRSSFFCPRCQPNGKRSAVSS
ncbi:MAG: bifunctional DNA-formamidopyrimidine glycosylase/DNA-(apurinic or apyrimidinic site) lyase [Planctomycetes bacterium]|nr:bifunctional DNA-formamidopyrimidine glycosylase/DNA-(apurinic or apyrimidinic site) lyase [Planctomycetota bacterium]